MKLKRNIHFVAICLMALLSLTVQAMPMLTPGNVVISSGSTGELILKNAGTGVTSYQTDVYLPNGITMTNVALSNSSTDHQCAFERQANGAYRIIVSSQTLAELPEQEVKCSLSAPVMSNVSGKAFLRNTLMVYTNGGKGQRPEKIFFVADKANKLSASVNMQSENSGIITMDFSKAEGMAKVTGIQMDIVFGESMTPALNADGSLKAACTDINHTIASEKLGDGTYRIVVSSMSNIAFADSELLTLPFTISNKMVGKSSSIAWANITYVLADGSKTYAADDIAAVDLTWEEPLPYITETYDFAAFVSQSTPNLKLTTTAIEQSGTNAKTVYVMDDYDNLNLHGRIALDSNDKTDNMMRWIWRKSATNPYQNGLCGKWHGSGIAVNSYNLSILNLKKDAKVTITYAIRSGKNAEPCICSADVLSTTKDGKGLAAGTMLASDTEYYMLKDGNLDLYVLNDNLAIQKIVIETAIPNTNIALDKTELNLDRGESSTLTVVYDPEESDKGTVFWKSSNTDVATVSNDGVVTAVASGTAVITATYASCKTATCQVTVKKVYVSDIELSASSVTLEVEQTTALTATVSPGNATNKSLTWTSSDTSIATVDESGVVTALAAGTATITATANDGSGVAATCTVTIKSKVVYVTETYDFAAFVSQSTPNLLLTTTAIEQSGNYAKTVYVMEDYDNLSLHGRIALDSNNRTNNTMRWIWRASATDAYHNGLGGNWNGKGTEVESYNLSILNLKKDAKVTITYAIRSGKNGEPCICSADVLSTTKDGKGLAAGTMLASDTEYYMLKDGNLDLYVLNDNMAIQKIVIETAIPDTNIALDKTELNLDRGESSTLTVVYDPEESDKGTVFWKSSNTDVATVSNDGVVTAVASGTAVITATYASCKTATCQVTVKKVYVSNIELSASSVTLEVEQTTALTATVSPDNATNKSLTWTSSDTSIATVDESGVVTALAAGTATITATANDGSGVAATCTVTIKSKVVYVTETYDFAEFVSQSTPNLKLTTTAIEQSGTNAKTVYVMDDYDNLSLHGRIALDSNNRTNNTMRWIWRASTNKPYQNGLGGNWHGTGTEVESYNLSILNLKENDKVIITYAVRSGRNGEPCVCSADVLSTELNGEGMETGTMLASDTEYYMLKDGNLDLYVLNDNMAIHKIVVETIIPTTNIALDKTKLGLFEGETSMLNVTYDPEEDSKGTIFWKSSDTKVATVSAEGVVTAVAKGTATITATYASSKTATCSVFVASRPVLKGDADGNGEVTKSDAKLVTEYYTGMAQEIGKEGADMNGDNKITMADANAIVNYLMSVNEATYYFTNATLTTDEAGYSKLSYDDGASIVLKGEITKSYTKGGAIYGMTSIKLSNAQENVFYAPDGQKIESVTFISVVNKDTNEENRTNYWNKVNGVLYSVNATPDYPITKEFKSFHDYENPDIVTFKLNGVSSFNFKNTGYQPIVILKVKYQK